MIAVAKKLFSLTLLGALLPALLLVGAGVLAPAEARELKLAHFMPPVHKLHRAIFVPFAKDVEKATNGELTIKIYPSGQLGRGPVQQYKRVVEGVADIVFGIQSYSPGLFPRTLLAHQPGVGRTSEEMTRKMWQKIQARHLAVEYTKVKLLFSVVHSPTVLIMKTKPVYSVADLKGMKIRIGSALLSPLVKAWGGAPVAMPITKVYTALSTGVVDGVLIQPSALFRPWKLAEPGKYVTTGFPSPGALFFLAMNLDTWNSLTSSQQRAIDSLSGETLSVKAARAYGGDDIVAIEKARKGSQVQIIDVSAEAAKGFARGAEIARELEFDRLAAKGIDGRAIYADLMR